MAEPLEKTGEPVSLDLSEEQYRDLARAGRVYLFRRGVRDAAGCEDLVHDALVKALRGWKPGLGTTFASFFLHVVLPNEMLNWFRARRTHASQELNESIACASDLEAGVARRRAARALAGFRTRLNDTDRAVLDCAIALLGSLGTNQTNRGEPHNFASRGAQEMGMTRHLFLAAWDRLRNELRRVLEEYSRVIDD